MAALDKLGSFTRGSKLARWCNRFLILGLCLFALAIPHSIAGAHVSLNLGLLSWVLRDVSSRRLHFKRTPFDLPLLLFSGLTVISAIFSESPRLSLPKLLALTLPGVIYLIGSNLNKRGAAVFVVLLLTSSLAGALFSLGEKVIGRGIVVSAMFVDSPLHKTGLLEGDVIWMIGRKRVSSVDDIDRALKAYRSMDNIPIEAIHEGDPLPIVVQLTDPARPNALRISGSGSSRRFRASGFSRHFLTFADQMQITALLAFGLLLAAWSVPRQRLRLALVFAVLSTALMLTASRGAILAFLAAVLLVACLFGGKRTLILSGVTVFVLAGLSLGALLLSRDADAARLMDDSSSRRVAYMKAGLRVIPSHPVFGVGMDSHKEHWREWGFPGDYVTHTHSTPIQVAMDRGLPALGCLIWFFAIVFRTVWRARTPSTDEIGEPEAWDGFQPGLSLGTLGALAAFCASALINYNFGDSEVLLLVLALVGTVSAAGNRGTVFNRAPSAAA